MNKNIIYLFVLTMLAFVGCEPIEDRKSLAPAKTASELESTISIGIDGNTVSCVTTNADLVVYWETSTGDYGTGYEADFFIPLRGDYSVVATFYGGDDKVSVTKTFTIAADDKEFFEHEYWDLLGTYDGADEKTWVWAEDNTHTPGGLWGNGGALSPVMQWWIPNIDDLISWYSISLDDVTTFNRSKLTFDTKTNASPGEGSGGWMLNVGGDNVVKDENGDILYEGTLSLIGHSIPLGIKGGSTEICYKFQIIDLNENELRLRYVDSAGTGWFWMLKRQGYTY